MGPELGVGAYGTIYAVEFKNSEGNIENKAIKWIKTLKDDHDYHIQREVAFAKLFCKIESIITMDDLYSFIDNDGGK